MKYDIESNIASFEISGGKIAYAKEINGTIVHISTSGFPVYIEILNAGSMIKKLGKIKKTEPKVNPAHSAS